MAGIILYNREIHKELSISKAREAFKNKSYQLKEESYSFGKFNLYYYHDFYEEINKVYVNDANDTYFVAGSLFLNGKTGDLALKLIDESLNKGEKIENLELSGNYVLIIFKNNNLYITRDLFGEMGCYTNDNNSWFTTNFLSSLSLNPNNNFSKNELIESILFGITFGNYTVVKGINLLESSKIYNLTENLIIKKQFKIPSLEWDFKVCLEKNIDALISEFTQYKETFDNNIISALSGGFDTRLMVALMLEVGIKPDLYVYGADSSLDVVVAKNICNSEKFPLLHINKLNNRNIPSDNIESSILQNLWDLDSLGDVFSNNSDVETRLLRSQKGGLVLNGSGGGIYRDNWKWDFKNCRISSLLKNSYDTGELENLNIDKDNFFKNIEEKVLQQISPFVETNGVVTRQQAEIVFPIVRSKFYYGSNTLNNYFSSATFPFLSQPVTIQSFSIPHKLKRYGEFERNLIKKLNPKLASYNSDYGFDFLKGPNFNKRFKERFYSKLNPSIKSQIKLLSGISRKSIYKEPKLKNPYLDKDILNQIVSLNQLKISHYLPKIASIKNDNVLNRIYTYELLSKKFNID